MNATNKTNGAMHVMLVDGATGAEGGTFTLKGSTGWQDNRGLHADRPVATTQVAGTTYWSVDEPAMPGTVYVTDGATWEVYLVL